MSAMRDSTKPADWVAKMVEANPIQKILGASGAWDGNIRSCPVRLNFFHNSLHTPVSGKNDDGSNKVAGFEVQGLFPPCAQSQIDGILRPLLAAFERQNFPNNFDPNGVGFGLHSPIRDQGEKRNFAGFTPGGALLRFGSQYKPPVVDTAMNPIVDTSRAYPGVWALVSFNMFAYGVKPPRPKKGVSFGLNAVVILADDTPLAGGAVDPATQFTGIKIDGAYDPAAAFGTAVPARPAAPPSILPPPRLVNPMDLV
jgi:hypothetical protein